MARQANKTQHLLLAAFLVVGVWVPHAVLANASPRDRNADQALKADRDVDLEVEMQFPPCSERSIAELAEAVKSLLPLKQQVAETQLTVKEMYNTTLEAKKFLSRIKSDDKALAALQDEASLLRREVSSLRAQQEIAASAARLQARAGRAEVKGRCEAETAALQGECVSKIMQLGNEAQEALGLLRAENDRLADTIQECNTSAEAQLEELREENAALLNQLEALNGGTGSTRQECGGVGSHTGVDADDELKVKRRQPKLSPGKHPKTEDVSSSISKMPPTTYKHSCKGFTEPSAAVAPSPSETSIRIGNRQYIVGKEKVTWGEAWRLCKARGMWVLTLETEQEQQQLEPHMMHMHNTPTNYWMFARKSQSNGLFSWECSEGEFEPWRHYQPPAPPGSSKILRCAHVEFHRSEPTWADSPCDFKMSYICRKLVTECTNGTKSGTN